ncbi:MAG TPA: peptidoglycan-binding domain-containing protein [Candidatus Saccharimonadales bacterium]|nr:peptidoglycan-binding domain-containing protein [Candidatus Saccharimonadales bacterium]
MTSAKAKRLSFLFASMALTLVVSGFVVTRPATASAATCKQLVFRQSSTHQTCVTYIQRMLNDMRSQQVVLPQLSVDGYFGPKTKANVMSFQHVEHIGVDGIVGPQTWTHLCNPVNFYIPNFTFGDYVSASRSAGC